ncbi:MAG: SDR family oxidoreductase [Rhodospirillales bacterium]|nr:SDR family oxidoreductase [Rhodospirillales bacterium]
MDGRICLVTGGTGGIGLVTARELARLGADVVVVGRDRALGEAVSADLAGLGGGAVTFIRADLSSQSEIRSLAATLGDRFGRLDVLVNNAGAMFGKRTLSADGIEMTFALNHLAYVLLSVTVLPLLRAAGRARIVNVASEAHRGIALPFDNLQGVRGYGGWPAYKRSKLANLMFTYELARRLDDGAITVNALHPGFVATEIGARNKLVPNLLWRLASLAAIRPDEGARTSIYLASSPEVAAAHGQYFIKCAPAESSPQSLDRAAAERLWTISEELCGIPGAVTHQHS